MSIGGSKMELLYYKCPVCGFTYQVPAYWSDFSPEEKIEFEHYNLETKELCCETELIFDKQEKS
jgi:rRNA maturation protein Nop10